MISIEVGSSVRPQAWAASNPLPIITSRRENMLGHPMLQTKRHAPQQLHQTSNTSVVCRGSVREASSTPPAFAIDNVAERDLLLETPTPGFDSIKDALGAIARGELVVVLDDEDRENEGDLIMAADCATPETMAFMVRYTSGVVCVGMMGSDLDRLRIPLMVPSKENEEAMYTAFTVTVDYREGTTTGISASDRAVTLKALADPNSKPEDFKRPGHIFPLRYREGGVLRRPGHTEASVDLARLAGRSPAGILCEVVNDDGTMSRTAELLAFAAQHGLKCITIADLVRYRLKNDTLVQRTAAADVATRYGNLRAYTYSCLLDNSEHVALVLGSPSSSDTVLACIHSESIMSDVFGGVKCNDSQLDASLRHIASSGYGVLVYLRGQQGRGLSLAEELAALGTADTGVCETPDLFEDASFPVDLRDCGVAAHILHDIGISSVNLLTNKEAKAKSLAAHGIEVVNVVPLTDSWSQQDQQDGSHKRSARNGSEPHFV